MNSCVAHVRPKFWTPLSYHQALLAVLTRKSYQCLLFNASSTPAMWAHSYLPTAHFPVISYPFKSADILSPSRFSPRLVGASFILSTIWSIWMSRIRLSSVTPTVANIGILIHCSSLSEGLWKSFRAFTTCILTTLIAWAMGHVFQHQVKQLGILFRIRKLGTNNFIYFSTIPWPKDWVKKQEQMHVRKSTFLKFDSVDIAKHSPQVSFLYNIIQQCIFLKLENSCNYIWSITWLLPLW